MSSDRRPPKKVQDSSTFRPGLDTAYKMVGPLVFGLALGYFIDQKFGTRPWAMLGLMLFGMVTGFWSILKQVYYPELVRPEPPLKGKKEIDDETAPLDKDASL